jgi:hypothetical protein
MVTEQHRSHRRRRKTRDHWSVCPYQRYFYEQSLTRKQLEEESRRQEQARNDVDSGGNNRGAKDNTAALDSVGSANEVTPTSRAPMTVTPLTSPMAETSGVCTESTENGSEVKCSPAPSDFCINSSSTPIYSEPEQILDYDHRGRPKLYVLTTFKGF